MFRSIRLLLLFGVLGVLSLASGCATHSPATQASTEMGVVRFAATGCGPYKEQEFFDLARYIEDENQRQEAEFLVHLGDILPGAQTLDRAYSRRVARLLRQSDEPVFVVLGDNEWNDQEDPETALSYWKRDFQGFHEHWSNRLGWDWSGDESSSEAIRSQPDQLGNFAFLRRGVLFIGITLTGGRVHDGAEWSARLPNNAAWIAQQFEQYGDQARAAVVMAQARLEDGHVAFVEPFRDAAGKFAKPVLYLHADGHVWEESRPFEEQNILVVQTDEVGIAPPVLVTVRESGPDIFEFDRRYMRGPYLAMGTPSSMTVVWRTATMRSPVVRYGTSPDALDHLVNTGDILVKSHVPESDDSELHSARVGTRQYEATITGLQPGTTYYYAVDDGETQLAGGSDYYFNTHPTPGSDVPARFWIVGDSGKGNQPQAEVHNAMRQYIKHGRPLDFYVHVGDMAYSSGTDEEFQKHFFQPYDVTLRNVVCWPAMGNHEGHTSSGETGVGPYYDAYVLPTKGESGGLASGTEAYYSFDYGNIHFIALNSHDLPRNADGAMAMWLKADLEQTHADWLVAFWHHPPYTKGSHNSDTEDQLIEMREQILPILEAGGVDVVLTGHSHIYERSMFIDGAYDTPTVAEGKVFDDGDGDPRGDGSYRKSAGLRPHDGSVHVVAGHGGTSVSRIGTSPVMKRVLVEHGSVIAEVDGDTFRAIMLNHEGEQRDVFEIVKRGTVTQERIANPKQLPIYVNYARHVATLTLDEIVEPGQDTTASFNIPVIPKDLSATIEWDTSGTNWTVEPATSTVKIAAMQPTAGMFNVTYAEHLFPLPGGKITYHTDKGPVTSKLALNVPAYRTTSIKSMSGAPKIDGKITAAEVKGLTPATDMIAYAGTGSAAYQSTFNLGIHGNQLYVAISCMEPEVDKIVANPMDRDGPVWQDDCVEVFIQREGSEDYYQLNVSAAGVLYDAKNGWDSDDVAWDGPWDAAVHKGKDRWTVEYSISLDIFDEPINPGDVIRFNLCRNNVAQGEYSQWSHTNQKSSHAPQFFGRAVVESE